MPKRFRPIRVGPLPVETVNRLLDTELDEGEAWLSMLAHEHIAVDHPDVYQLVLDNLTDAVLNPTYIGQDPKHGLNFFLIKSIRQADKNMLVALGFETNKHGNYNIRSAYTIGDDDLHNRRQKGHIKRVLP